MCYVGAARASSVLYFLTYGSHSLMHDLLDFPDPNVFGVEFSDTLKEEDYDLLDSTLADHLQQHTTTRAIFVINDVTDWTPEEKWEDLAFDIRHLKDLDKVAVVGDDLWETWLDKMDELFPMSQIQTYEDQAEALDWLRGDMAVPGLGPGSVSDPEASAQNEDDE
jgi:hypothetical protein